MVGVRVGQYKIIQSGDLLLLQIILDGGASGIVARINQHGVSAAGDKGCVALPHVDKMYFHLVGI